MAARLSKTLRFNEPYQFKRAMLARAGKRPQYFWCAIGAWALAAALVAWSIVVHKRPITLELLIFISFVPVLLGHTLPWMLWHVGSTVFLTKAGILRRTFHFFGIGRPPREAATTASEVKPKISNVSSLQTIGFTDYFWAWDQISCSVIDSVELNGIWYPALMLYLYDGGIELFVPGKGTDLQKLREVLAANGIAVQDAKMESSRPSMEPGKVVT